MVIKYTHQFLNRLEDLFSESEYILRYEKGNFSAGYCILKDTKIAIVNKYFPTEGKINCLIDILRSVDLGIAGLTEKNRKLYFEIIQTELPI